MVLEILFVVDLFLMFLTMVPFEPLKPWTGAYPFLTFVALVLLGLFLFVPGLR